jgi:acetyl esterase/lipase
MMRILPSSPLMLKRSLGALVLGASLVMTGCADHSPAHPHECIHRDILFASPGGHDLHMDLYVPETPHHDAPVVVWIFGGSWKFGSKAYHVNVRELTKSGIAVASIQYRLSGTAKYPAQLDDCRTAVQWLRENGKRYGIDPQRIGVSGESAGGHLAALLGTTEGKSRIRAVFALFAPADLVALSHHKTGLYHSNAIEKLLGGPVEQKQELAREANPITHVSASSPPFLIMHGARDKIVPPEQSLELERALVRAHVEVRRIVVPDKGHWFRLNAEQLDEVARFFQAHFGMRQSSEHDTSR